MIRQKTWPPGLWVVVVCVWGGGGGGGGEAVGAYYPYISKQKTLKIFLSEISNYWTNFNITWQKCFFGDSLPRLFKPS